MIAGPELPELLAVVLVPDELAEGSVVVFGAAVVVIVIDEDPEVVVAKPDVTDEEIVVAPVVETLELKVVEEDRIEESLDVAVVEESVATKISVLGELELMGLVDGVVVVAAAIRVVEVVFDDGFRPTPLHKLGRVLLVADVVLEDSTLIGIIDVDRVLAVLVKNVDKGLVVVMNKAADVVEIVVAAGLGREPVDGETLAGIIITLPICKLFKFTSGLAD